MPRTTIETSGLTKRYDAPDGAVHAVADLDLAVEAGEVFGFLGPNGAGKSTTIDVLLDYVRPTAGRAEVLGFDASEEAEAVRRRVGVLPEGLSLYARLSGRRHLAFAAAWLDVDADVPGLLARVGLSAAEADQPAGTYSTGMSQRLALAMALVGDPEVLILDEPAAGLDPHGIRRLREVVRAEADRGATVFFSSHHLAQVEAVCDRVGILAGGRLVAVDTVDGLRRAVGAGAALRVRVGTSGGETAADADPTAVERALPTLRDLEGVTSVECSDGLLRVACADSRAKARAVALLVDAGVDVLDVDSAEASLADVFAAYTGDGGLLDDPGAREAAVDGEPSGDGPGDGADGPAGDDTAPRPPEVGR
ncbi:MAG: ABC transporter ATP-binding protein [Halobacteriaceae archaeon]